MPIMEHGWLPRCTMVTAVTGQPALGGNTWAVYAWRIVGETEKWIAADSVFYGTGTCDGEEIGLVRVRHQGQGAPWAYDSAKARYLEQAARVLQSPPRSGDEPTLMSNYDHQVKPGFEEWVAAGKVCRYAGWDFNGRVWKADGQYHCEVWVYGRPRAIISAETPEQLIATVSARFGED